MSHFIQSLFRTLGIELRTDPVLLGNTLADFLGAAFLFAALLVAFKFFQWFVLRRLERAAGRTKTDIDDTVIEIFRSLRPSFYSFLAFYLALQTLTLHGAVESFITAILIIWVVYQVVVGVQIFINYLLHRGLAKDEDPMTKSAVQVLGRITKGVLWGIGVLLVLQNLGVNITSLLAGVGIGGIAIAFALQNVLADLFSSFAIYFDKPFTIGDFIVVGDSMGTVERIGIKTTRLRALGGEEITISNQELTSSRVQNYGRMQERRVTISFGVEYGTDKKDLERVPGLVQSAIEAQEKTRFEYANLVSLGESALTFEAVYYIKSDDYNEHLAVRQAILLAIKEKSDEAGMRFAYPTQTVYVQNKAA